jgi:hypothetical protein
MSTWVFFLKKKYLSRVALCSMSTSFFLWKFSACSFIGCPLRIFHLSLFRMTELHTFETYLPNLRTFLPIWSLASDHTQCILKLGIIKPANESSRFVYIQLQPRFARAKREPHIPIMECAGTIAYLVTHTLRLLLVLRWYSERCSLQRKLL